MNLDPRKFRARLAHIDERGDWVEISPRRLIAEDTGVLLKDPRAAARLRRGGKRVDPWTLLRGLAETGVVFPALHGPMGEDGTIQGLFEMAGAAYVGCGVLGSALAMDKESSKRVFEQANIPQVPWAVARNPAEASAAAKKLRYPIFVKPARLGSSVGISKVASRGQLQAALRLALRYDDKAILEQGVAAREIEIAVLGDPAFGVLKVSRPGEIIPRGEFYDYNAKYIDPDGAELRAPTQLPKKIEARVKGLALSAFRALDLAGLARVDFFVDKKSGAVYLNEANTMPGFTPISMYPLLWRKTGIPTRRLVTILVDLARRRRNRARRQRI